VRGRLGPTALLAALALGVSSSARAQDLPSGPVVFGAGRVTVGGEASATFSCASTTDDSCSGDTGFFNYSDYERSTLRGTRFDLTAAVKASGHLSVLADLRVENGRRPTPYALYARIRPWEQRSFDIQVGRIPPTFGAFSRRTYANDNFLIGYPLAYQYLTSLRPDALPANADELLRMRGRGWRSSFSVGDQTPDRGLPIANVFRWDTGVQVHVATRLVDAAASATAGSLGNPLVGDDNAGKQVAGRAAVHPSPGFIVGASVSRGPFVARTAGTAGGVSFDTRRFTQTAAGVDVEYSRDHYLVRLEAIASWWALPALGSPAIAEPLGAVATSIEGRYKIHPRVYAGARFDHLGFSTITGTTHTDSWDAPVTRIEVGAGYSVQRNLHLKVTFQHNARDGGRVRTLGLGAVQVLFWF
jgi:hypothetical protein